jgi:hypothetical protein
MSLGAVLIAVLQDDRLAMVVMGGYHVRCISQHVLPVVLSVRFLFNREEIGRFIAEIALLR